jgi:MFS family permease
MKLSLKKAWGIWAMAGLFYLYEYVLRVSPMVVMHTLMKDYNLNATSFGLITAVYYWAYVPLQIPCGYILDKFGVRKVVTFSTLLCTIGCFIFSHSDVIQYAYFGRFLMGAGSACAYVACMKVGSDWFPAQYFPLIAGLTLMMGQIGSSFGAHPFALLVHTYSYITAMNILVGIGIFIAVLSYVVIPPKENNTIKSPQMINPFSALKTIMKSKQNWAFAVYGLLLYVGIAGFSELWSVIFLMTKMEIHCDIAATQPVIFFMGVAFGSPIISSLGKKLKVPYLTMASLGILGTLLFSCILFLEESLLTLGVLLFLMGAICGGHVLCFVNAKERNPIELSGTTLGFINAIVMMSGLVFQPLIGFLLDIQWDNKVDKLGVPVYSLAHLQYALSIILFCYFTAFLIVAITFKKEIATEIKEF